MKVVVVANAGPSKPLRLLFCDLNRLYMFIINLAWGFGVVLTLGHCYTGKPHGTSSTPGDNQFQHLVANDNFLNASELGCLNSFSFI